MMTKKLSLVLLLAMSAGLAAQEGGARLTLFGSASLPVAERNFTLFGEDFRTEYDNGGKVGVRGTMDLSNKWALEGTYAFGANAWHVTEELGTPHAEHRAFNIHRHQLTASLLRYLNNRSNRTNFFIVVGGGLARFSPTEGAKVSAAHEFVNNPAPNIQASNQWSVHAGAGLETRLTDRWGIRIDVEDHIIPVPRFGLPETHPGGGADFYPQGGVIQDIQPSLGIVYRWK